MRNALRAFAFLGVPIVATAAITLGPLEITPDDVQIPQRIVEVDPTSLDSEIASLYRAITAAAADDLTPKARSEEKSEEDVDDASTLKMHPSAADALGTEALNDDLVSTLAGLGLANRSNHPHKHEPSETSTPSQRDGRVLADESVTTPLDLIDEAGSDPAAAVETPPAEDTTTPVLADPITPPETFTGSTESSSTPPGADHDGPDRTGVGALTEVADDADRDDDARSDDPNDPRPATADTKKQLQEVAEDNEVSTTSDTGSASRQDRQTRKPLTSNKLGERAQATLRDIERSVRKAVEGLRPQRSDRTGADE